MQFSLGGGPFFFESGWLRNHIYDDRERSASRLPDFVMPWGAELAREVPSASYDAVHTSSLELANWLGAIRRYGFAVLREGPIQPAAVLDVVALFGFVRETNYGKLFDVRTEVNPSNLAFTGLALSPHTDNPYRDPAPTIQVLYCLENSAMGGASTVVDGFAVAEHLSREHPEAFDLLSRYPVNFEFAGTSAVWLSATKPILEVTAEGQVVAVRYNNRSIGPISTVPFDDMVSYYDAMRTFETLLNSPEFTVTFRLEPGECFVVDNTRVLHGRTGYAGEGSRWLQGCYADKDGLNSRLRVLKGTQALKETH